MSQLQDPHIILHVAQPTAVVRKVVAMDQLADFYDTAFSAVAAALGRQGARPAGAAFGLYRSTPVETFDLEAGFPVEAPITDDGEVVASELPGGEVAHGVHVGGYDALGSSWDDLIRWVAEEGRLPAGPMWEVYVTEPTPEMDPATLRTELFLPLAE